MELEAKKLLKKYGTRIQYIRIIFNLIEITNKLNMEEDFKKYLNEWKKITGKDHPFSSFPEDNDNKLSYMLDTFENLIRECPNLILKADPGLIELADELIEGVEVD